MAQQTSIEGVRKASKMLLHAVPIKKLGELPVVQHPFTNSLFAATQNHEFLDLSTEEGYKQWIETTEKFIDTASVGSIFHVGIGTAWKLTWLKFTKPYLSDHDFSRLLAQAWVMQENPNQDANVNISTAIKWFKEADKRALMEERDYEYWENLPDPVVIFRGVSPFRARLGLSWSDDEETALWFKKRWEREGKEGVLLKATIPKKHCLAYLNTRGENEIVVDVNAIKDLIEVVE